MVHVTLKLHDDLYRRLCQQADELDLPLSETVVRNLAIGYKRPDWAYVERKRRGIPRRNCVEAKN